MLSSINSASSLSIVEGGSAFCTPDVQFVSDTHVPAPPVAPQAVASPRRLLLTEDRSGAVYHPGVVAASTADASEVCLRLSERNTVVAENVKHSSPRSPRGCDNAVEDHACDRPRHLTGQDVVVVPTQLLPPTPTAEAAAARVSAPDTMDDGVVNPLHGESPISYTAGSNGSHSTSCSVNKTTTRVMKETSFDDALRSIPVDALPDSSDVSGGFSLSRLAAPRTAEEYYEQVSKVDHVRCGLGQELVGDAKDVYGPTWAFSKRMFATPVFGHLKCGSPNCDHKAPLQAVTGPYILTFVISYVVLFIYPVFTTVAYAGKRGQYGIIPLWVISGVTAVFVALCSITNPGIVPRRRLKNFVDYDATIIVRVPAPNALAVLDKLQALPDVVQPGMSCDKSRSTSFAFSEVDVHQAVVEGDIPSSVFNHRQSTLFSMERYFETDTGRLTSYSPVLSESDLAVPTVEFPVFFCRTCRIVRGPRTHHCSVCDNCVDDLDHHCKWTNCCIGYHNYPYFFMSLVGLHVMAAYSVLYNVIQMFMLIRAHKSWTMGQLLRHVYGMPIVVVASTFLFGLFFFPLFLGHIYMTAAGLTTNEMLKRKWSESKYFGGVNPWSHKHWWMNVYTRLLKWRTTPDDLLKWMDSRYYYGVAVAAAVEDLKVDWLMALPPEEREKVQERAAAEHDEGMKARPAQEKELIEQAMQRRGFHDEGECPQAF